MANVSKLTIGSTTYDIKDSNAALCYNLSAYNTTGKVLPADYYKAVFHLSGEPAEMKYIKTTSNATECSPLATNTQYIVFGINRLESNNYYYWYIVFKYTDRTYVGSYNSTSGSAKRPTILNKVFFDETDYSDIQDVVDDYYNSDSIINTVNFTDNIGVELECCITDKYQNEASATVPCATVNRAGVMTKTDKLLISKIAGVQGPVDITSNVKTWMSDNNYGTTTDSVINAGSMIDEIHAGINSGSPITIDQYKVLYFNISTSLALKNGTSATSGVIQPGTYVCKQIDGQVTGQPSNKAYYTFTYISRKASVGGIYVPVVATGFIHLVYKTIGSDTGWCIERIGKCYLSYGVS